MIQETLLDQADSSSHATLPVSTSQAANFFSVCMVRVGSKPAWNTGW